MRRILTLVSLLVCLAAGAMPALAQAPTAVEAHTNGSRQIEVTWNAVANATGHNVYAGTTQGGPYTLHSRRPSPARTTSSRSAVPTSSETRCR